MHCVSIIARMHCCVLQAANKPAVWRSYKPSCRVNRSEEEAAGRERASAERCAQIQEGN